VWSLPNRRSPFSSLFRRFEQDHLVHSCSVRMAVTGDSDVIV
jgi:hypothetical protein